MSFTTSSNGSFRVGTGYQQPSPSSFGSFETTTAQQKASPFSTVYINSSKASCYLNYQYSSNMGQQHQQHSCHSTTIEYNWVPQIKPHKQRRISVSSMVCKVETSKTDTKSSDFSQGF
jgi:hypothetical protein